MIGVSVRECARQLGISDTAILKAIKAGRCTRHADGSVDVEAVRQGMNVTADPLRGGQRQAGVFGAVPVAPVVAAAAQQTALQVDAALAAGEPTPAGRAGPAHAPLLAARTLTEQTRAAREQIELAKLQGLVAETCFLNHDVERIAGREFSSMTAAFVPESIAFDGGEVLKAPAAPANHGRRAQPSQP